MSGEHKIPEAFAPFYSTKMRKNVYYLEVKTKFHIEIEGFGYHSLKNVIIRAEIAVALYMSAWIEIRIAFVFFAIVSVALYMIAWIEMISSSVKSS